MSHKLPIQEMIFPGKVFAKNASERFFPDITM
jgi:hypothetical protein